MRPGFAVERLGDWVVSARSPWGLARCIEPSFKCAAAAGMDRSLPGPDGGQSQTERRLRHECEQLKLALAEATVQLRIWQKGSEYIDSIPSPTSRP